MKLGSKTDIINKYNLKYISLFFSLIFLDQLTKHAITKIMFTSYIGFIPSTNTGAGFSILYGQNILLSIITFIFVIWIFYLLYNNKYPSYNLPFLFVLSGAIGNLIDRIFFGHVFDFIKIYSWPVFNLADIFLNIGVIWIIYIELSSRKNSKTKTQNK